MSDAVVVGDVAEALEELREAFPGVMSDEPDGSGGAYVTVDRIELNERWSAETTSLTFHLPFNYPAASPYPYYVPGELSLSAPWPPALQRVQWRGRNVIQVSLRHASWDPTRDRVTGCVMQVADWLRSQ